MGEDVTVAGEVEERTRVEEVAGTRVDDVD